MRISSSIKKAWNASLGLAAVFVVSVLAVVAVQAEDLHLKDGSVITAEEIWESDFAIWYRQGRVIASVPKTDVVRITRTKSAGSASAGKAPLSANPSASSSALSARGKSKITAPAAEEGREASKASTGGTNNTNAVTHKVTRLLLKDGTQIDADSIWEESERVAYRLGKMQTFVERTEVAKIIRDVELAEEPAPSGDVTLRFSTGNRSLDNLIVYSSARHRVDPLLIYLVMREESGFNYRAVSRVGARGLMQLMPGTAQRLGVRNIHDPMENIDAGTRYLRGLIDMFGGDVNLALAAYNAGEGAVLKYGRRIPPYAETVNYVWRINTAYRRAIGQ